MDAVRPDYGGAWVGAIVPALLGGDRPDWLPEPARSADNVVLLVLDGVGWHALEDYPDALPELRGMAGQAITTVGPSTTSSALTSITTGATPAEHGVIGYRMRVGGEVLNVLRWRFPDDRKGPDATRVQPVPPFFGTAVPVVTRAEFRDGGFTEAQLRGAKLAGWQTTSTLVEHCRRLVGQAPLVYAYYDGPDKVAHEYGLRERYFPAELAAADRLVGDLLDALPAGAALLVTADHGQVHVGRDNVFGLAPLAPLVAAYSGEGRFRSLYARTGEAGRLLDEAAARYGDVAWVFSREQLFDDGWFGAGASAEVRGRVGDVVLAARGAVAFADPTDLTEVENLVSYHGSLTRDEMLVPLLAGAGRGQPGHRR